MSATPKIGRRLRPGDLGRIVALHGRLYSREYGVDSTFEAHVGAGVARAAARGWPRDSEGVWLVEREGELAGCIAYTDEGDGLATLRWFVLDPSVRGQGLGRRLVGELLDEVQAKGFDRIRLETFSELRRAAGIYLAHGFELTHTETSPRWGREAITYQHYELELAGRPQSISTTAPPRRGSPPPSSLPSSGSRATA